MPSAAVVGDSSSRILVTFVSLCALDFFLLFFCKINKVTSAVSSTDLVVGTLLSVIHRTRLFFLYFIYDTVLVKSTYEVIVHDF